MNAPGSGLPGIPDEYFVPEDPQRDTVFYQAPRMVAHIDDAAIVALGQAYHELIPEDGDVLDLMSSRYSHLPAHLPLRSVTGLGMNGPEMAANPQLTSHVVHDLNADPRLPFPDNQFTAVICAVSVQYLRQPVAVFREVARVLTPGYPVVVAFSNRCFPTKAVPIWLQTNDEQHFALITRYLDLAGGFTETRWIDASPNPGRSDPLYLVTARKANDDLVDS